VLKVSNIKKMRKTDDGDDDSDDSEDDDEDGAQGPLPNRPLFTSHGIKHVGTVNRVRVSVC
jgi:hypothetical protein